MLGSLSAAMSVVLTLGQAGFADGPHVFPATDFGGFDSAGFGGEIYPYDAHYPWVHGYFQELPAYGGHVGFRPYNYRHVFSQTQAASGWGLHPALPYSQQFWHRYHERASLHHFKAAPQPPIPSYPKLFQR